MACSTSGFDENMCTQCMEGYVLQNDGAECVRPERVSCTGQGQGTCDDSYFCRSSPECSAPAMVCADERVCYRGGNEQCTSQSDCTGSFECIDDICYLFQILI